MKKAIYQHLRLKVSFGYAPDAGPAIADFWGIGAHDLTVTSTKYVGMMSSKNLISDSGWLGIRNATSDTLGCYAYIFKQCFITHAVRQRGRPYLGKSTAKGYALCY
jgi:hypothetical protein